MLSKTKKIAFLTSGLAGALVVSSAVGVALSSCSTTDTSNSDTSIKYTYSIDWTDQDQVKQLTIDEQGLVYSSANKSEIIAVAPNTAATSFVIPASVRYITGYNQITKNSDGTIATSTARGAFQNSTSLISVTFASDNTLVSIGDSSFSGCTYLSTINLPSSTSVVYNNAFAGCTNLRSINLVGVSYIGSAAFQNAMVNGAGVSIDLSSATYIGDNAFSGSTSLVNVDFSKNTTLSYIGRSAFANTLSSGSAVATLDLSKATTLKTISDSAFLNCTNLGSVILPSSSALTTIGQSAFSGATNLTQVGSTANTFNAPSTLGNYATTTVNTTTYVSSGIGANAFNGTKIANVDLSAVTSTTPLANAAFKNMTALASVNFGSASKITTIPYSLFEGDTALTSLTLPASITTIQDGTNNLKTTDTTVVDKKSPFYGSGLKTVDMSAITSYATGTTAWYGVTIDNTTAVPGALFQNLTSLTSVVLKKGTVVISSDAFNGASALTSVKEGSASTAADTTDGLVIPSTLEMINSGAFLGTGIKSIAFANTTSTAANKLWFIGKFAFQNAKALTSVDLTTADTTTAHTIKQGAIYGSNSTIDTSVTGLAAVSEYTFSGASALQTVSLPTSITNIYSNAFVNNTALNSVNFNTLTNLTDIASTNFTGASALKTIDLSANSKFTSIKTASSIFTGLPADATVTLPSIATSLASNSFLTGNNTTASVSARPNIKYDATTSLNLNLNQSTISVYGNNKAVGALGSGSSSGSSLDPMLQYISGDYDLTKSTNVSTTTASSFATGAKIALYYPFTFFGNTKLTGLTMSVSDLALGGSTSAPTQATKLFMINSSSYQYNSLPFGGNTALQNFTFNNFSINSSPTYPSVSGTAANNPLYKTTVTTWAQVATIINKFASNGVTTVTTWPTVTTNNQDSTSKINFDSNVSGAQGTSSDESKYIVKFTDVNQTVSNTDQSQSNTVSASFNASFDNVLSNTSGEEGAVSSIFYHNGVKWILTVYSPTHATNPGAVTLVGENVNIYKGSNSATLNSQIPFATTTEGGTTTANKITVTLNIVPSTKATA